jgi:hypothetical protein
MLLESGFLFAMSFHQTEVINRLSRVFYLTPRKVNSQENYISRTLIFIISDTEKSFDGLRRIIEEPLKLIQACFELHTQKKRVRLCLRLFCLLVLKDTAFVHMGLIDAIRVSYIGASAPKSLIMIPLFTHHTASHITIFHAYNKRRSGGGGKLSRRMRSRECDP